MSDNKQAIIFNIRLRADQGFELYPGQVRFLIEEAEECDRLRAELDALRKQEPVGIKSVILDIAPSGTTHIRKSGRRSFSGGEFAVYFECFKFEAGEWSYYYTDNDNEYPQWRSLNGGHYRKPDEIIKTLIPLASTPAPVAQKVHGATEGLSSLHGYAGAMVWIGDRKAIQMVSECQIRFERLTGESITCAAQKCLDMIAAAQAQEGK